MKLGILGTGTVGKALVKGLLGKGYDIEMGTRDPAKEKLVAWRDEKAPKAILATFSDVARNNDFLILAVGWEHLEDFCQYVKDVDLAGKIIIDVTNPIEFVNGVIELEVGFNDSAGEMVQRAFPNSHVVKAFNAVAAPQMANPHFEEGIPDMFIAGNDNDAKKSVTAFLEEIGWRVIDAGGIEKSRWLEPFALLFIDYSIRTKSAKHGFSMLRE